MTSPAEYFRAGAGAVIINNKGLVLALERINIPGAWQLPQGGLEAHEEPIQGALREVAEETGIVAGLEFLDSYPEPLVYELPVDARSEKTGRGQVQYWFLFRYPGPADAIDLKKGGEFRSWKWTRFDDLLNLAADFRKPVYRHLARKFRNYLKKTRS